MKNAFRRGYKNWQYSIFLGACYIYTGENSKADEMWNKSLALEPNQEEITKISDSTPLRDVQLRSC